MKPCLLLACCLALALPVSSAPAAEDPFAGFRIPDHSWQAGSAGLLFSGGRHHQSAGGAFVRSSSLDSDLRGGFRAGWDSDALQYGFGLSTDGRLATSHSLSGNEQSPFSEHREDVGRDAREDWTINGSLRAYPWKAPIGLGVSASASGSYAQSWFRNDRDLRQSDPLAIRAEYHETGDEHDYQTGATAGLSAGYGRVRDASVVYDVHLLEERLTGTGAITRPLSAAARAKLAALYYVSPYYSAAHERPDRFVWREIERVLREDGALGERGLDPYSVLRARESTGPSRRPTRLRGWFVGLVGQLGTGNTISRQRTGSAYRVYLSDTLAFEQVSDVRRRLSYSSDDVGLGGQGEYHLPIGWRWQLDATSRVTRPARTGEYGLTVTNDASLSWFVADRWAVSASLAQDRGYFRPRGPWGPSAWDSWAAGAGATIAYFVEDHTMLSLSLDETQRMDQYASGNPRAFDRDGRVSFGISYRFLGSLEAPGLVEPVLPLR